MNRTKLGSSWLINLSLTLAINLVVLFFSIQRWAELKIVLWRSVWAIPGLLYVCVILACVLFITQFRKINSAIEKPTFRLLDHVGSSPVFTSNPFRFLALTLSVLIIVLIPWLKFYFHIGEVIKKSTQDPVLTTILFYWLLWWFLLAGSWLMMIALRSSWEKSFGVFLVLSGVSYEVYTRFQGVNFYPFSLGWSEASRYYYASLFVAEKLYGSDLPLSILHPSRYLLQSLPFFFAENSLFVSRVWQSVLWIGLTAISSLCIVHRIFSKPSKISSDRYLKAILTGSIFLFLLRVGVYYHLHPIVFIPLLLADKENNYKTLAGLILASAWAGISRINWFPMPAMIISILYLFEVPFFKSKNAFQYLLKPASFLVIGVITAFLSQQAYITLSGNAANAASFSSSFSSALLWDRLLPNSSFAFGILPGVLLVSFPILFHFIANFARYAKKIHPIRAITIIALLVVLFIGGLVVSIKIGGGGDLHNMDAFAVLLVIVSLLSVSGNLATEINAPAEKPILVWPVLVIGLLLPIFFLIPTIKPLPKFNDQNDQRVLGTLKKLTETSAKDGDVLFINERHLLTFGMIDVPIVNDYEAVTLMEMAMSDNQTYLQTFYSKLKQHEFSAIVTGKLNTGLKTEGLFFEENNVWNSTVSQQILCYYQPVVLQTSPELITVLEAEESKITVLVPKNIVGDCP